MTVYVDDFALPKNGAVWFHMMADTEAELHEFADGIGLERRRFQDDHYDVTASKRTEAVKAGAVEVTSRDLVDLRVRKCRNEFK